MAENHKEDFFLLVEGAFIAAAHEEWEAAMEMFQAAHVLDPKNTLVPLGLGYLHIRKSEFKEAVKCLEAIAENEVAKALLGIALMSKEREKAEEILHQLDHSKQPLVKKLSHSALHFMEIAHKPTGPASPQTQRKAKRT